MASPFQYFRKNSGTLMAITVVLSMFAFTLTSLFSAEGTNYPMLGLMLGSVLLCFAGIRSGKILQFALVGGIIGFCAGWILPAALAGSNTTAIATKIGTVSKDDVDRMVQNRMVANQFVQMIGGRGYQFGFGYEVDRDVMLGELLRKEADEMGIVVNDAAVNHFIKQASQNKMTAQQFKDVRKQFGQRGKPLTEAELYDMLRDEIKARLAIQMVVPFRGQDKPTPDQYWDLYKRMNVSQEIVAAGLPVTSFVGLVAEPDDSELRALFEKHSTVFPNELEPGAPGFRQPKKMRLAALEADYATIESSLTPLTDAEIKKYYEDNKDREFTDSFIQDDSSPADSSPPADDMPFDDGEPGEADNPADAPATGKTESTEPADKETTTEPAKSKTKKEESVEPASTDPAPEEAASDKPDEPKKPTKKPAADSKSEADGEDSEPDNVPEPQEDDEKDAPADDDDAADDDAAADEDKPKIEPIRYLPLTDDLKDEIRGRINRERTLDALTQRTEDAAKKMRELADKYILDAAREANAAGKEFNDTDNAGPMASEMKAWGEANGLKYIETPNLTYLQFANEEEYPLGSATEPVEDDFSNPNPESIAVKLFNSPNKAVLYNPAQAEDQLTNNRFAYWVIEETDSKVPTFEDDGIREQVVEAWKTIESRPLAKKRAEELKVKVEAALADGKTISDALAEETTTGAKQGVIIAVRNAPRFSWMRRSSASPNSFMPQPPVMSQVIGVDGAGRDFMRYVFEELNDGDVGVVPNSDFSSYYIVQAINRTPSSEENVAKLREEFMKGSYFNFMSPIAPIVRNEQLLENSKWTKRLEEKYDLDWNKFAAMNELADQN